MCDPCQDDSESIKSPNQSPNLTHKPHLLCLIDQSHTVALTSDPIDCKTQTCLFY